jgi:hypothetical protein
MTLRGFTNWTSTAANSIERAGPAFSDSGPTKATWATATP